MDSEGWLPAALIASFRRMQTLSADISTIVQAVSDSDVVEIKDGVKFRPKNNPLSWPLAPPSKDPSDAAAASAKKDGGAAAATLNPNVPEFVPSFGGGAATTAVAAA